MNNLNVWETGVKVSLAFISSVFRTGWTI